METLNPPLLKALSTSSRQEIIKLLARRPYTASELSKLLGKHVTTVAEHLEVLEKSGLIYREAGSKWVYYKLTPRGQNLLKPSYSWAILFSLSFISLFAGSFLYATSSAYLAQASKALPEAAPAEAVQAAQVINANAILGVMFITLAIAGFAYIALQHLRAKTLRNQSLYIK